MKMSVTFTQTRTIAQQIRRDIEVPDHIAAKGEEFVMIWATHNALPTIGVTDDWKLTPEPPPVVVCVDAREI
jgi:hypothetical protein